MWNPWTAGDIERLENVQKKALKQVAGLQAKEYEEKVAELGLTTLEKRRTKADLIQVYKIIHRIDKVDRNIWFELNGDIERRTLRGAAQPLNIIQKRSNLDLRRYFFSNRVTSLWNALPEDIKTAKSVKHFKTLLTNMRSKVPRSENKNGNVIS